MRINHHVYFHEDPEEMSLLHKLVTLVTNQGAQFMSAFDDVVASLSTLETSVTGTVVPLLTAVGTELDALSTALTNALAAGSTASLAPIKERIDAVNKAISDGAAALAAIATKDAPPAPPAPADPGLPPA